VRHDATYWAAVESLFAEALAVGTSERAALLEGRCDGHAALRMEVEGLLSAFACAGDFISPATVRFTERARLYGAVGLRTGAASAGTGGVVESGPSDAAVDRTLGHYHLIERIGAGGMGEVFRARDLALGRDAALKLLSRRFDAGLKEQLLREAESSAKLQHPAIATFYEAGEADGEAFIAMELVHGHTLRRRLADGPLPVDEALAITSCLLEALEHAHAAGILHRDIKPENIVLPGAGSAKLLDLGIATPLFAETTDKDDCMIGGGTPPRADAVSRITGTIGYLAPEQILGERLDARTDVFQVALVLFEMLTGRAAFSGLSPFERLVSVMTRDPDLEPVRGSGAPAGLDEVLRRALARDPANRHPRAAALLRDLQDVAESRVVTALPRIIAVCELDDLTGDADLDWVAGAITESLRADLARLTGTMLVPREKVRRARDTLAGRHSGADPVEIGLRVGCGWTITGGVERSDDRVRATVRLVEIPTGRSVVTETATATVDRLFDVEDRLLHALRAGLNVPVESTNRSARGTSIEAQAWYARARLQIDRLSKGSLEDARVLLERAIEADDRHAEALGALASTYALRSIATTSNADIDQALTYADRALAIDPRHVRAHVWKGYALTRLARFAEAESALRRAIELDPGDTDAYYFAAFASTCRGRHSDALPLLQRAVELDAGFGMWWLALGHAHLCLNRRKEALYSFTRARKLEHAPRFATAGTAGYVAEVLRLDGHLREARTEALAGIESAERSDHAYRDTFRAHGLTVLGRVALDMHDNAAADAAFSQILAQARGRPRARSCGHFVAQALGGLGRTTDNAALLDEAIRLFDTRDAYDFGPFYGAMDDQTLFELALCAAALDREDQASLLVARARAAGSLRNFRDPRT
jgi:serine/threonine-protein kinase